MLLEVTGATRIVAVFGHPVHHSMSPVMQNAALRELALDFVYVPCNVHPDNLESAIQGIRALDLAGANITIPHKERVIGFLDWVSEEARLIGSVNTILNDGGVLKGFSTDGEGFLRSLKVAGGSASGSRSVILGAGGSARAIAYALATHGSRVSIVNRTTSRAVDLAKTLNKAFEEELLTPISLESEDAREAVMNADLLVNCTSVGMYPGIDEQPIPTSWLHNDLFVYDQIYNPLETSLIRSARALGLRAVNGVGMLVFQGASSFKIWTGKNPPTDVMEKAVLTRMAAVL